MNRNKFNTRTELKSLRKSIKCAETECGRLRMFKVCFDYSSMRLGDPFIAPRQLGAVGGILGRQFLPSVGWRTGQSGASPDSPVPPADRWLGPRVARGLRGRPLRGRPLRWRPLAHRTVRCTTGQSGEL
jgi:hypothetical protein